MGVFHLSAVSSDLYVRLLTIDLPMLSPRLTFC